MYRWRPERKREPMTSSKAFYIRGVIGNRFSSIFHFRRAACHFSVIIRWDVGVGGVVTRVLPKDGAQVVNQMKRFRDTWTFWPLQKTPFWFQSIFFCRLSLVLLLFPICCCRSELVLGWRLCIIRSGISFAADTLDLVDGLVEKIENKRPGSGFREC